MKQATLIVLSDTYVKEKEWIQLCHQLPLLDWSPIAQEFEAHRELFYDFPAETLQRVEFIEKSADKPALLRFNGIRIELCRHLVRCYVDVPFRTWVDYEDFRIILNRFLSTLLRPFQTQHLLFLPSRWEQPFGTVKNEWHEKRLQLLQTKITQEAVSFKRTLQHLRHCLGEPGQYYGLLPFFDIDSGRLSVWAELTQPISMPEMGKAAAKAQEIRFPCHDAWRNNSCPYRNYAGTMKQAIAGNSLRNPVGNSLQNPADNSYRNPADNSLRKPAGNSLQNPVGNSDRNPAMSGSTNPKDANAGFLANQGTCGLLPYSGNMTSLTEWMATKGYICWNKHCFFTLYLHSNHLQIIFSKPAATLMRKENRNECMLFIATLLSHFSIKKAWAGSAETFETAEQTAGSEQLENYLKERHLIYDEAELIQSWREDILKL